MVIAANTNQNPCAACSSDAECEVWSAPVCYPCAADWQQQSPTYGEIADKYGPSADNAAVYRAFTQRWIERRKASAA